MIDTIEELTTVYNVDNLVYIERLVPVSVSDVGKRTASSARIDAVTGYPFKYLRMRLQLFSRQIGLSGNTRNPGLPIKIADKLRLDLQFESLAQRVTDYQMKSNQRPNWWQAGAIHHSWPWMAGAEVTAVRAQRRRRARPVVVDMEAIVALVLVGVFITAPQIHFRFVAPLVAALVSAIGLCLRYRPTVWDSIRQSETEMLAALTREKRHRQRAADQAAEL